jgi:FKBP-type peptidyl-prolyl cis-trans isomerase
MRRIAVLLSAPLIAVAALAGCGSSSPSSASQVSVSGRFGAAPAVTIPTAKAGSSLTVKTVVHGNGPALGKSDAFIGNYAVYIWSGTSHRLVQSTFTTKNPQLFAGPLLPGLKTALVGQKMGSRVLAVIPPAQGYGKSGNPQAGVKPTDTLVFVVDMLKEFAPAASASGQQVSTGGGSLPTVSPARGTQPQITIPSGKPPSTLVAKTLIKGTGPALQKGDTAVVQYVGEIWQSKNVFDASWKRGQPFSFQLGAVPSQVIPGWDKGLLGQPVGSRVLLVIPPADGYGKAGQPQAGIKGTDTLVFVVDIVGAVGPGQPAS